MAKEVYELISMTTRGRYWNRIGLFDNQHHAEKAMLKFIDDEKLYYEDPEDGVYENDYLGFEIGRYIVHESDRISFYNPFFGRLILMET